MQQYLTTSGAIIGGLGLFLLAVGMITNGLKLAAGNSLKSMLANSTSTPLKGIVTGITITAIVQSSSAVTVATIGFVNAGLLNLYQALGVVFGANIGTTMTGWLVAIIGFKIKVEIFALPLIGFGMIMRLLRPGKRLGSVGEALAGFGLFFIGIDVLQTAFEGLAAAVDLKEFQVEGVLGTLLYVSIGFIMTLLTQSSSAAIAITLTAATGGVLNLEMAAAMVIGANLGTTSTAAFAVIGATANAKRVAVAHILFNLLTGIVALILLPILILFIKYTGQFLGLDDVPAVSLALFHTVFNILGVILILPRTDALTRFLTKRFITREEIEGAPRYLDKTVIVTPSLALNAMTLELGHVATLARQMSSSAISTEFGDETQLQSDRLAILQLGNAIGEFLTKIRSESLSEEVASSLPNVLHGLQRYTVMSELALDFAKQAPAIQSGLQPEVSNQLQHFYSETVKLINDSNPQQEGYSAEKLDQDYEDLHTRYRQLREVLLEASIKHKIKVETMVQILEQAVIAQRIAKQAVKGAAILSNLLVISAYPQANIESQEQIKEIADT